MAASKFLLLLLLVVAVSSISAASAADVGAPANMTHLHFYFYEFYDGPNQSSFIVAKLNNTSGFGTIRVYDNALREEPGQDGMIIGRQQGLATIASLDGMAYLTTQNFVFTAGEFNGSSIALIGRANGADGVIERSIVGGSGQFRMASGYAISKLLNASSSFIYVENDFYVLH